MILDWISQWYCSFLEIYDQIFKKSIGIRTSSKDSELQSCQDIKLRKIVLFVCFVLLWYFLLLCCMVTIDLLTQTTWLRRIFRCFENSCKVSRKFSRDTLPKFSHKKTFIKVFKPNLSLIFSKINFFHLKYDLISVSYGHDFFCCCKEQD